MECLQKKYTNHSDIDELKWLQETMPEILNYLHRRFSNIHIVMHPNSSKINTPTNEFFTQGNSWNLFPASISGFPEKESVKFKFREKFIDYHEKTKNQYTMICNNSNKHIHLSFYQTNKMKHFMLKIHF